LWHCFEFWDDEMVEFDESAHELSDYRPDKEWHILVDLPDLHVIVPLHLEHLSLIIYRKED